LEGATKVLLGEVDAQEVAPRVGLQINEGILVVVRVFSAAPGKNTIAVVRGTVRVSAVVPSWKKH